MEQPEGHRGEILIKTMFGVVAQNALSVPIYKLSEDEELRQEMGVEGGPYCWTEEELEIPF